MKLKNFFRAPYDFIEETYLESKRTIFNKKMADNDKANEARDAKLETEITRSTTEDNDFNEIVTVLTKDIEDLKEKQPSIEDAATKNWVNSQGFLKEVPEEYVKDSELEVFAKKEDADKALKKETKDRKDSDTALETKVESIKLNKINQLQYSLIVDGKEKGVIDIPKDQFLKSVSFDDSTNLIKFVFSTLDGENEVTIDMNSLENIYEASDGIKLEGDKLSLNLDPASEEYLTLSEKGLLLSGINDKLNLKLDVEEHVRVKNLVQENLSIKANKDYVNEQLALKADKENLNALNTLVGKVSNALKAQIETEAKEREKGDANLSGSMDIQFELLLNKVSQLEDKLSKELESNAISLTDAGSDITENNTNRNFVLSGELNNNVNISGKNVVVKNLVSAQGKNNIFVSPSGEVSLQSCKYSGKHDKESQGNTVIAIQSNDAVSIKDCDLSTNTYNELEISLNGSYTAKNINIDNCVFGGTKANNAVSIFGLKDDAVINITNCVFNDVSNPLRISNHSNATGVTINIINCKVNKWESNLEYHGFICMQDYTSGSAEKENENKQFSTMKVNFVNLMTPDGVVKPVGDPKEVCGSGDAKQLIYVYYNKGGLKPYSEDTYPTVNVK